MDTSLKVCRICLLLLSVLTVTFQEVKAARTTQKGSGKPFNCVATAFSSRAVLLTWKSVNSDENENPRNFSIYYRPLYSMGDFTIRFAGNELYYLVENLDVITYYAFRIGTNDSSGNLLFCEVLARTLSDARLSVPLRIYRADNKELRAEWKAVTPPQDAQPIYRLFMQWRHKGKLNVRLLYEGDKTAVVITGKLPVPNKKYVSVVLKNIAATTNFKHLAANILTSYPTKQALFPANKPVGNAENEALPLRVSIDACGWNFVRFSIKMERSHVTYQVSCRAGEVLIKIVTSNTSVLLFGLDQLTRYQITVEAQENNATLPLLSAEAHFTTLDRDECTDVPRLCRADHSECVNTRGSYFCRCSSGWTGDGTTCKEVPDNKGTLSYCDKQSYLNITWLLTAQGQTALALCPAASRGIAKRACLKDLDGSAKWGVPDFSECISEEMANIALQLRNPNADFTDIAIQLVNATSMDTHAHAPLQTGDVKLAVDIIVKISQRGYPPAVRNDTIQKITQAVVKSSSNILDNKTLESWKFMPKDSMAAEASKLLKGLDAVALHLARTAISSDAILSEASNVVLSAKSTEKVNPTDQQMPPKTKSSRKGSSSSVVLPGSVIKLQQNKGNQGKTQYITFVAYRNLKALMQPNNNEKSAEPTTGGSDVGRIDSEVISVSIYPMNINNFEEPVTLIIKNNEDSDKDHASCVFWNMTGARGLWSGAGCYMTNKNSSHTTCQCHHLTSFAVLMRVKRMQNNAAMEEHSFALSLISYIGISISVVALTSSFFTFTFLRFRNTRQRYFVHANLALSLGLAETLFLFGITKTTHKIMCKAIAIILHYLFLVSFSWMALEGVVLYLMLVKIFRSKTRPARDRAVFLLCGWGLPAIVVGGSAVLFHEGYGTKEFCWLSFERHFTWAFVGPVLFVCLFNFICLGKTFMIMSSRGSTKTSDTSVQKIRYWSKGCALLSCLLGITWIVGVFVVNQDTIFMAYLFNILNTLQGLLIFLFHCIGDEKVRAEYLRLLRCQTRAMAYGAARPWWSRSDSVSRLRTSDKLRRSTLHSNLDSPKVTTEHSMQRRSAVNAGPEYTALRQSINRPVRMSQMYGITEDDCQQNNEETHMESWSMSQRADKNSEEVATNTELVKTGLTCSCKLSSQSNLPDIIQKDCRDIGKTL